METIYTQKLESIEEIVSILEQMRHLTQISKKATERIIATWMLVRETLSDVRNLLHAIEITTSTSSMAIDPEDQFADKLLQGQQRIRLLLSSIEQTREATPKIMWLMRFILWRICRDLLKIHAIMGQTRTIIMEHDADVSPRVGPFDNADDLINSLRS